MCDSVPYFVVIRYRNPKLTRRRRFASYHDATDFVNAVVTDNKYTYAVMPFEVRLEVLLELPV